MELKDVRKLATHGPMHFEPCKCSPTCKTLVLLRPHSSDSRFSRIDAMLMKHCWDHFDEVVNKASELLYELYAPPSEKDIEELMGEMREILAKAKNVEEI